MLWIKLLIVAIIITAFLVAALSLKLFFSTDASSAGQSCHIDDTEGGDNDGCSQCSLKEIAKCDEKHVSHKVT